ncbi:MAG TPA: hypothetical protein VFG94_01225 [Acidimicrobiales bacterium]|jgi:hypothetical protein|nr:hypothetical protein [Acidimicrobiales bacterium]
MTIDWAALAIVAVVSLAIGVLVVVLVSFALVGLSARQLGPTGEAVDETPTVGPRPSRLSPTAGAVTAALCLLGAAAIVLYGFYVLVF